MKLFVRAALLLLAATLVPAAAFGGEAKQKKSSEPQEITPDKLASLKPSETRYSVIVHFKSTVSSIVRVREFDMPCMMTRPSQLDYVTSLKQGVRLKLVGWLGTRSRRTVFFIKEMEKVATDVEIFLEAIAALAPDDGKGRMKLAEEAAHKADETGNEKLKEKAEEVMSDGIIIEEKNIDHKNPDELIRVGLLYAEKIGDLKHAFRLFEQALAVKPKYPPALKVLRKFGAHFYNGTWMTHDEFMLAEGFLLVGEEWIHKEEKFFRDAIAEREKERRDNPIGSERLRVETEDAYKTASSEHRILRGMTREEVVESLGYPETVARKKKDGRNYDQWNYPGGVYVYFENGEVFLKRKNKK